MLCISRNNFMSQCVNYRDCSRCWYTWNVIYTASSVNYQVSWKSRFLVFQAYNVLNFVFGNATDFRLAVQVSLLLAPWLTYVHEFVRNSTPLSFFKSGISWNVGASFLPLTPRSGILVNYLVHTHQIHMSVWIAELSHIISLPTTNHVTQFDF
jgi:hypothetical protein